MIMNKSTLLIFLIVGILSCKKEEPVIPSAEKALWVTFDEKEQPFNTATIYQPKPSSVSQDGYRVVYNFNFDDQPLTDMRVEIISYVNGFSSGLDSMFHIGIGVYEATVLKNQDGECRTVKYLRQNDTIVDSALTLSLESPIISPFTETTIFYHRENKDSRPFNTSDRINLLDTNLMWDDEGDKNSNSYSLPAFSDFYIFRDHLVEYFSVGPYGSVYELNHDFHRGWLNLENRVFLFRWFNRDSPTGYYYGWMELSLTENREFTIHKVVYQVD